MRAGLEEAMLASPLFTQNEAPQGRGPECPSPSPYSYPQDRGPVGRKEPLNNSPFQRQP